MRRFQTVIAIIFETRLRPCRIAACANSDNDSLTDCFQVSINKSRKQFRLTISLHTLHELRFAEKRTLKNSNRHAVAISFSQESARPPATTGLLEQRHFERLRLHWLAQPGTLSAPPKSAKPRSHSERREVKALVVRCDLRTAVRNGLLSRRKQTLHCCHIDFNAGVDLVVVLKRRTITDITGTVNQFTCFIEQVSWWPGWNGPPTSIFFAEHANMIGWFGDSNSTFERNSLRFEVPVCF